MKTTQGINLLQAIWVDSVFAIFGITRETAKCAEEEPKMNKEKEEEENDDDDDDEEEWFRSQYSLHCVSFRMSKTAAYLIYHRWYSIANISKWIFIELERYLIFCSVFHTTHTSTPKRWQNASPIASESTGCAHSHVYIVDVLCSVHAFMVL